MFKISFNTVHLHNLSLQLVYLILFRCKILESELIVPLGPHTFLVELLFEFLFYFYLRSAISTACSFFGISECGSLVKPSTCRGSSSIDTANQSH